MPPIKLRMLEKERGDLHAVIPPLVDRCGQIGAAQALGVSSATISRWLKDNGYKGRMVYKRDWEKTG